MRHSICIIIPYFGKLPSYFDLFLRSCEENPDIDWLLLTDDSRPFAYPSNVRRRLTDFESLREMSQRRFDFPISLDKPYKLCDYKPAYGYLFEDELKGYAFWGYCDVDLLFGDLRAVLTDRLLEQYDKIGQMGHLTLCRNTPELNRLFMREIDGRERYREVFSAGRICVFDEWDYPSINDIFLQEGKRVCRLDSIADIYPYDSYFRTVAFDPERRESQLGRENCMARWDNGRVFLMWKERGAWREREALYIHLQKRDMERDLPENARAFYIVPNRFAGYGADPEVLYRGCKQKQRWNTARWRHTYGAARYWLIEKSGPVRHWFRDRGRRKEL